MQLKIFFYGKTNNDTNSLSCVTPKMQTALKLNSIKAVSFLSVIPLVSFYILYVFFHFLLKVFVLMHCS